MSSVGEDTPEDLAREGYNTSAQRYLDWTLSLPSPRESQVRHLLSLLPSPSSSTALELGSGAGVPVTRILAESCARITANDISSAQITLAREHLVELKNIEFHEGSMMELAFPPRTFDVVVACYSVIHLSPADQRTIFKRIHQWLRPGGLMLVNLATIVTGDNGLKTEGWLGMKAAYWSSFGTEGNRSLLKETGFEIIREEIVHDFGDAEFAWIIARSAHVTGDGKLATTLE